MPREGKPGTVTITLELPAQVVEHLAVLDDENENDDAPARARRVLHTLADHAQQGVYRPGSWERVWIQSVWSVDQFEAALERDPAHPMFERPRKRGDT